MSFDVRMAEERALRAIDHWGVENQLVAGDLLALIMLARELADEYDNVIESEFGTGKPDSRFAEKWPALAKARAAGLLPE